MLLWLYLVITSNNMVKLCYILTATTWVASVPSVLAASTGYAKLNKQVVLNNDNPYFQDNNFHPYLRSSLVKQSGKEVKKKIIIRNYKRKITENRDLGIQQVSEDEEEDEEEDENDDSTQMDTAEDDGNDNNKEKNDEEEKDVISEDNDEKINETSTSPQSDHFDKDAAYSKIKPTGGLPSGNYASEKAQKILSMEEDKSEIPENGSASDSTNQLNHPDVERAVYRVDRYELQDILDYYLGMGKEKWAGFLATSNSNKFQKLINKLKNRIGNNCNEEVALVESHNYVTSKSQSQPDGADSKEDNVDDDYYDYDYDNNKEDNFDHEAEKYSDSDNSKLEKNFGEQRQDLRQDGAFDLGIKTQNSGFSTDVKPSFPNSPKEKVENFQELLTDVITYWENEDAKKILESSHGLSYQEFELEGNDYDLVTQYKNESIKKSGTSDDNRKASTFGSNIESQMTEEEANEADLSEAVHYETSIIDEDTKHKPESEGRDLLESMAPDAIKSRKQKEWLKENALRRAKIMQGILNGDFDEYSLRQDIIKYREGNIFLEDDKNEFVSNGIRIQSKNMALYVFFIVEVIMSQIL